MDANDRRKLVTEEAAEWWVLLQGEVSRAQREQYVDWLRESTLHVAEMLFVARVHGALEQFQRWPSVPTDGAHDKEGSVVELTGAQQNTYARRGTPALVPRERGRMWIMAATLLIMTSVGAILLVYARGRVIQTERGERREVALTDGSVVQLDPETRLRVKYERHARRIFLESGRVLFHVAKNADCPFLVESNNTAVRAVGTAFAVEKRGEAIVVTVAEGKVAVIPARAPSNDTARPSPFAGRVEMHDKISVADSDRSASTAPSGSLATHFNGQSASQQLGGGSAPEILLTANQQVTVASSGSAEPPHAVDSRRALAWADGRLVFENSSVGDAIREFNRYNRIKIIVNDNKLAQRRITGVFSAADPESFVAFMQLVTHVHVSRNDGADIYLEPAQ